MTQLRCICGNDIMAGKDLDEVQLLVISERHLSEIIDRNPDALLYELPDVCRYECFRCLRCNRIIGINPHTRKKVFTYSIERKFPENDLKENDKSI